MTLWSVKREDRFHTLCYTHPFTIPCNGHFIVSSQKQYDQQTMPMSNIYREGYWTLPLMLRCTASSTAATRRCKWTRTTLKTVSKPIHITSHQQEALTAQLVHPVYPVPPHCPYLATEQDPPPPGAAVAVEPAVVLALVALVVDLITLVAVPTGPAPTVQVLSHPEHPLPALFVLPPL